MPCDTQSQVVNFLSAMSQGEKDEDAARQIHTHISTVVLKGDTAWKLKRAIRLPYVDFSTPELRYAACQREVALNRRTAPSIYRAARRITREADGRLMLEGSGELVDAVVEMARFDDQTLFSRLAAKGGLTRPLLTALARDIAHFHRKAEVRAGDGADNIAAVLDLNEQSVEITQLLDSTRVDALRKALRAGLDQHRERLTARSKAGRLRLCHGDLHLRNICLVEGGPTLFDCIEFNDALATTDVLYDLAFLLMDLWQAGLREEANWVMNRYVDESGDHDSICLLPYFMSLRASIRAQVLATQALMAQGDERAAVRRQADAYLQLAMQLLHYQRPKLLAIGGFSGSGKSTLAAAIAHHLGAAPGARVLSSDRIRKRLAGVQAETRLPAEQYTLAASQRVYATLYSQAHTTLQSGHAVVADAVFSRQDEREMIEHCAQATAAPFQGIWLSTDTHTLLTRVQARRDDASDATADVVAAQLARGAGKLSWPTFSAGLVQPELLAKLFQNLPFFDHD